MRGTIRPPCVYLDPRRSKLLPSTGRLQANNTKRLRAMQRTSLTLGRSLSCPACAVRESSPFEGSVTSKSEMDTPRPVFGRTKSPSARSCAALRSSLATQFPRTSDEAQCSMMSPSSCVAFVAALCMLLPESTAFVAPGAFMRPNTAAALVRSTHSSNAAPALKMAEEPAAAEGEEAAAPTAADISKGIAHPEAVFTVPENILKVLPHRYPFALVDKVLHFVPGKSIIGVKCITNNEPQFTGHFPDLPIMPGVLQVTCLCCRRSSSCRRGYLLSVHANASRLSSCNMHAEQRPSTPAGTKWAATRVDSSDFTYCTVRRACRLFLEFFSSLTL